MSVIGIDMDGVIADFPSLAMKSIKSIFGIDLTMEDLTVPNMAGIIYPMLPDGVRSLYKTPGELYDIICHPRFFEEIEPYEGAIEAVKRIQENHDVVFITKRLEWQYCPIGKANWLQKHFGDMPRKVIMIDNMESKGLVAVDILFDDDPRAISSLEYSVGVLVNRPWNRSFREEATGIYTIDDFKVAPDIIDDILSGLYIY
jgi:5'(3')-deoxyribonucleotidase